MIMKPSKYVLAFITMLLLIFSSFAYAEEEKESPILIERDVRIPTREGFTLSANIFRPNKDGNYPVIMSMGPYGKDHEPDYEGVFTDGQVYTSKLAAFETPDPEYWVQLGYAVIAIDSPGANKSGGDSEILSDYEAEAYYDAIEWAGVQPWSNGNIGLNGVSYFAMSQWKVAALNPPHLKAIAPEEGTVEFYQDILNHGGIPDTSFLKAWTKYRVLRNKNPEAGVRTDIVKANEENKLYTAFWQSYRPDLNKITVPAYVVASWTDHGMHTRGTLLGYEEISSEQKWLEIHGRKKWEFYYRREHLERIRKFFDHFLKGDDNGMENTPTVRYELRNGFYDGADKFASDWPIPNQQLAEIYLTNDGLLSENIQHIASFVSYKSDEGAETAFEYKFEQDAEITGSIKLKLWVETDSGDDMDLFVGLSKLNTKGQEVFFSGYNETEQGHVATGWLRVSRRAIDASKSTANRPYLSHAKSEKISTNQIIPVEVEILPSSTLFKKGQSLVLRISGSELAGSGKFSHKDKVNVGQHKIHFGGEYASQLVIPFVK